MNVAGTALNFTSTGTPQTPEQRRVALEQAAKEVVSSTFFGEMLKLARKNPFKSEMFHGGRGEEMFQAQLDSELARRAGTSVKNNLSDAIVKRLSTTASGIARAAATAKE